MKPVALIIADPTIVDDVYGSMELAEIQESLVLPHPPIASEEVPSFSRLLGEVEHLFLSWGAPCLDAEFLALCPNLKAVYYGAGSLRNIVTDEFWKLEIPICSAWGMNAVPVAEYTLGAILLGLKQHWQYSRKVREIRTFPKERISAGNYRTTIGLVSLGMIGRLVRQLLLPFDHHVLAYDPFLSREEADRLSVEKVELEELFQRSHAVSVHTPWLPQTEKLIGGHLLRQLPNQAVFINTSRGAIVDEAGLTEVLQQRPDLLAILDVTYPEPPAGDSKLYQLENVVLTPHIAGSIGLECRRMGREMVMECKRFLAGEPFQWQITHEKSLVMA